MDEQHKIGLIEAVAVIVGCIIGASIFVFLGPITAKTGPSLWLVYLVAAIPAFVCSLFYCQLGSAMPNMGGSFVYCYRLIGPRVAAVSASMMVFGGITALAAMALGLSNYLSFYFPDIPRIPVAVVTLIVVCLLNFLGLKMASVIQTIMTFIIVIALFTFAIPGLGHIQAYAGEPFMAFGIKGFAFACSTAFFSYTGYQVLSEMGSEIKNPGRNLPLAILIALGTVLLCYMGVAYVLNGVVSWKIIATADASVPTAAATFLPTAVVSFISVGAILAILTTINAVFLTFSRDIKVLADVGFIPKLFAKNNSMGSPANSLIIMTVIAILLIVLKVPLVWAGMMTVVGWLGSGIAVAVAAWYLPEKEPQAYESAAFKLPLPTLKAVIVLGIILSIFFIVLSALDAPLTALSVLAWAVVFYFVAVRQISAGAVVPYTAIMEGQDSANL